MCGRNWGQIRDKSEAHAAAPSIYAVRAGSKPHQPLPPPRHITSRCLRRRRGGRAGKRGGIYARFSSRFHTPSTTGPRVPGVVRGQRRRRLRDPHLLRREDERQEEPPCRLPGTHEGRGRRPSGRGGALQHQPPVSQNIPVTNVCRGTDLRPPQALRLCKVRRRHRRRAGLAEAPPPPQPRGRNVRDAAGGAHPRRARGPAAPRRRLRHAHLRVHRRGDRGPEDEARQAGPETGH